MTFAFQTVIAPIIVGIVVGITVTIFSSWWNKR